MLIAFTHISGIFKWIQPSCYIPKSSVTKQNLNTLLANASSVTAQLSAGSGGRQKLVRLSTRRSESFLRSTSNLSKKTNLRMKDVHVAQSDFPGVLEHICVFLTKIRLSWLHSSEGLCVMSVDSCRKCNFEVFVCLFLITARCLWRYAKHVEGGKFFFPS